MFSFKTIILFIMTVSLSLASDYLNTLQDNYETEERAERAKAKEENQCNSETPENSSINIKNSEV